MTQRRYSKVIEADAERALLAGIRQRRGLCHKLKFLGVSGAPDRLVLLPDARMYFVELKQDSGRLEPSQEVLFPRLAAVGFPVHVLHGVDAVRSFLASIDERLL